MEMELWDSAMSEIYTFSLASNFIDPKSWFYSLWEMRQLWHIPMAWHLWTRIWGRELEGLNLQLVLKVQRSDMFCYWFSSLFTSLLLYFVVSFLLSQLGRNSILRFKKYVCGIVLMTSSYKIRMLFNSSSAYTGYCQCMKCNTLVF